MSLQQLESEKKTIVQTLANLNNVSQKALGRAPGARANLNNQINDFNSKLSVVNKKIFNLTPKTETPEIKITTMNLSKTKQETSPAKDVSVQKTILESTSKSTFNSSNIILLIGLVLVGLMVLK